VAELPLKVQPVMVSVRRFSIPPPLKSVTMGPSEKRAPVVSV